MCDVAGKRLWAEIKQGGKKGERKREERKKVLGLFMLGSYVFLWLFTSEAGILFGPHSTQASVVDLELRN